MYYDNFLCSLFQSSRRNEIVSIMFLALWWIEWVNRSDVPHIFKNIIEFEESDDVVNDTLKKYNIVYEFKYDEELEFKKN